MKEHKLLRYVWILPALFTASQFAGKIVEILGDGKQEYIDIVSLVGAFASSAGWLVYIIGFFDLLIAIFLLFASTNKITKPYHKYVFFWCMAWPFVPASLRYFGGVAEFEIFNIVAVTGCALVSYVLWIKYLNKEQTF